MLNRCSFAVSFLALAQVAAADVVHYGTVATPGVAKDKSGLKGDLAPDVPANVLGAHGSGIAWTGKGQTFLMVADRGPSDGATPFRCRWQTIELGLYEDGAPSAAPKCLATTLLSDDGGRVFVGDAAAGSGDGEGGGNEPGPRRLDPEAIRVGPDGTVYIADEYGPAVLAFSAEGKLVKRFAIPDKFVCRHPGAGWQAELPPANTIGRAPNHGFEGLAISPNGNRLYALAQGPLLQDGAFNDKGEPTGTNVRILELPVGDSAGREPPPPREFLYRLDSPQNGVNEILAVNDHEFLVIERDDNAGEQAKVKKIVKIDIAAASDISGVAALPATGAPEGVKPVTKRTVIDLLNPKFGLNDERMPAKIEGLAFGPDLRDGHHVLMVTSDNDAKADEATWVWIFGLDDKELPGFTGQKFGR